MLILLLLFKHLARLSIFGGPYRALLIRMVRKTALFDRAFYLHAFGDRIRGGISPLRHYVTVGDPAGLPPLAFFDPDDYRSRIGSPTGAVNALLHYSMVGRHRRISPCPWFDVDYYLSCNKDVHRRGVDPLRHYLQWGGMEGRSPSPEFDGAFYLRAYPDVARQRINPLLHYLQTGRFEGRRTSPEAGCADALTPSLPLPQADPPAELSWIDLRPRARVPSAVVDVVVPVYQGRAETLGCLHSVLSAATTTPFELVVIDDASPDAGLSADLQRLAARGLFSLRVHQDNQGFVRTANEAFDLHPDRDVVLLNSDTEVFDGWLDRLRQAARRHPRTATVTPLSNNATICSYPRFLQDNPYPLEIDYAELDRLTARVNAGVEITAPTGVGFCLYVRRAALNAVGRFDAAAFGRGYGEENDFCQRVIRQGWRNIVAADLFVHHWGAASFQGERARRIRKALRTLDRLHPTYHAAVARFIARDPLAPARRRLDRARLMRLRRDANVLLVCHNRGGGAERRVQEEMAELEKRGCGVFLLRPMAGRPNRAVLGHPRARALPNLPPLVLADGEDLARTLKDLAITAIHSHSLVDFAPDFPEQLMALAKQLGARWEANLHDYKVICPRINLADGDGHYCGEPSEAACGRCLAALGSDFGIGDIGRWRAMHRRVLAAADRVVVPDPDVAQRLGRYFRGTRFEVAPHEDLDMAALPTRLPALAADEPLRIVVIGAIGKIKGFEVLLAVARHARQRRWPLRFILMGYSMNDRLLLDAGVEVTGRYLEAEAPARLKSLSPHRVWLPAIWPETYSYTLSIALLAGLPVTAFDIGAIARRIRACGATAAHRLLPLTLAKQPEQVAADFMALRSRPHGAAAPSSLDHQADPCAQGA